MLKFWKDEFDCFTLGQISTCTSDNSDPAMGSQSTHTTTRVDPVLREKVFPG